MGMYDYLVCEMLLPEQPRPPRNLVFQTKDTTAQFMERFTITAGSRLIHHSVRYEEVPLAERPYPDMPSIGSMRPVPVGDIDINFHGMLEFHTYDSRTKEHWSYEAKFTDGQCMGIHCIEYERRN
jgi:hypothetical protein